MPGAHARTAFRPALFAAKSAASAASTSGSTSVASAPYTATPTETVTGPPASGNEAASTARRSFSATSSPPARPVRGSSTTNLSPR
jgi:hypothetical protein